MEYFLIKNHQPFSSFKWSLLLTLVVILMTLVNVSKSQITADPTSGAPVLRNDTLYPWLRLCQGKERYEFVASDCVGGYMFKETFPSGSCVCGNGIWILKSGYCDTPGKTFIIFAEGHDCFKINSAIRWVRYVGHPERAKLNSHYLISGDWDYVEALHKNGPSRQVVSRTIWTMAVGDAPDNIYLPEEKVCFRSDWRPLSTNPIENGHPYVRVGTSINVVKDDYPIPHQAQRLSYCPYYAREEQTVWFNGGGMIVTSSTGNPKYYQERSTEVFGDCHVQGKCSNIPPSTSPHESNREALVSHNKDTGVQDYPLSEEDSRRHINEELERVMEEPEISSDTRSKCPKSLDEYTKEIDKQTVRMIHSQAAWSLKQIKTPKVDIPEYKFLQKSVKILKDKCSQVPESLLTSFLRMFRFALSESLQNHPYRQIGDEQLYQRIKKALDTCDSDTGEASNKIIFTFNETSCPRTFEGMKFKLLKAANAQERNCSDARPKHLKFEPCQYDLVLDVAWKTILFTHYLCSKHFAVEFQDQSSYYTAMERLYNPDMMARFYSPGKSYDGLKYVFQMYNLKTFVINLDRCLACARSISQYRRWLKRPKDLKMCPMNGERYSPSEYNFDIEGFGGIRKNPIYLPYLNMSSNKNMYKCYQSWSDGLYTRPRENVPSSCGLGLHILGQTATYA